MGTEVISPLEEKLSLDEVAERVEDLAKGNQATKIWGVADQIVSYYDLVYEQVSDRLFIRHPDSPYYQGLDEYGEQQLAMRTALSFKLHFLPNQISDTIRLIKLNAPSVERVTTNCIMISEHLFWDKKNGKISLTPTDKIFRRLFDTSIETDKVVKVAPFTEEQEQRFLNMYEQVKRELERGEEIERFEPLKVWANGSHDVYMDLHRAHAACFLQKKPLGAVLLSGLRRNGKSTYIYLTHTIFGLNNTSKVQLTELGNVRKNLRLMGTLFNGPDEEKDELIEEQGMFKTLADHGLLELEVMFSQKPKMLECDFMCFFPVNHTPQWKGSGAGACMNRSLIIPFTAQLDNKDNASDNFMKETFTSDFMCEYLGSVFAYANYYHSHPFKISDTMKREQQMIEADLDSSITYTNLFYKYFYGFTSWDLVWRDYFAWCRAEDVKPQKKADLKNAMKKIIPNLERKSVRVDKIPMKGYAGDKKLKGQQIFGDAVEFIEFHQTVKEIHGLMGEKGDQAANSVITALEDFYGIS